MIRKLFLRNNKTIKIKIMQKKKLIKIILLRYKIQIIIMKNFYSKKIIFKIIVILIKYHFKNYNFKLKKKMIK